MTNIVERLTALHEAAAARAEIAQIEVERLRTANADLELRSKALDKHATQLEAEIERLRTDYSILKRDYDALREDWNELVQVANARRALEPKP